MHPINKQCDFMNRKITNFAKFHQITNICLIFSFYLHSTCECQIKNTPYYYIIKSYMKQLKSLQRIYTKMLHKQSILISYLIFYIWISSISWKTQVIPLRLLKGQLLNGVCLGLDSCVLCLMINCHILSIITPKMHTNYTLWGCADTLQLLTNYTL